MLVIRLSLRVIQRLGGWNGLSAVNLGRFLGHVGFLIGLSGRNRVVALGIGLLFLPLRVVDRVTDNSAKIIPDHPIGIYEHMGWFSVFKSGGDSFCFDHIENLDLGTCIEHDDTFFKLDKTIAYLYTLSMLKLHVKSRLAFLLYL